MQKHNSASSVQTLAPDFEIIESHTGIEVNLANQIADHYRTMGGYQIQVSEHQFKATLLIAKKSEATTTYQAVNS